MLKACLAVSSCISFTIWDVDDADSWVPSTFAGEGYATLYDVNLNPKTAYTDSQAGSDARRTWCIAPDRHELLDPIPGSVPHRFGAARFSPRLASPRLASPRRAGGLGRSL